LHDDEHVWVVGFIAGAGALGVLGVIAFFLCTHYLPALYLVQADRALASTLSGPIFNPPVAAPPWTPTRAYACFLCFDEAEAGCEARVIRNMLWRMLGCDVFMDSVDNVDLRDLFVSVRSSDVFVLLSTKAALTHPWRLLELYEATRAGVPVVVMGVNGAFAQQHERRFSLGTDLAWLRNFIDTLEQSLLKLNAHALDEIRAQLVGGGTTLDTFKAALLGALAPSEKFALATGTPLSWRAQGTEAQVIDDARRLCDRMAAVAQRTLVWSEPGETVPQTSDHRAAAIALCGTRSKTSACGFVVSYDRQTTMREARMLQSELARALGRPVIIADAADAWWTSLGEEDAPIDSTVLNSAQGLLLLQSQHVLSRPHVLLELCEALRLQRPVIRVELQGAGFDSNSARLLLGDLEGRLEPRALEAVRTVAEARQITLAALQTELLTWFSGSTSLLINPAGSDSHVTNVLRDIIEQLPPAMPVFGVLAPTTVVTVEITLVSASCLLGREERARARRAARLGGQAAREDSGKRSGDGDDDDDAGGGGGGSADRADEEGGEPQLGEASALRPHPGSAAAAERAVSGLKRETGSTVSNSPVVAATPSPVGQLQRAASGGSDDDVRAHARGGGGGGGDSGDGGLVVEDAPSAKIECGGHKVRSRAAKPSEAGGGLELGWNWSKRASWRFVGPLHDFVRTPLRVELRHAMETAGSASNVTTPQGDQGGEQQQHHRRGSTSPGRGRKGSTSPQRGHRRGSAGSTSIPIGVAEVPLSAALLSELHQYGVMRELSRPLTTMGCVTLQLTVSHGPADPSQKIDQPEASGRKHNRRRLEVRHAPTKTHRKASRKDTDTDRAAKDKQPELLVMRL
jgi:hypothetical protein